MKIAGAILGALGGICTILYVVEVFRAGQAPLFSDKLGVFFWIYLGIFLFLGAIVCIMLRKRNTADKEL